MPIEIKRDDSGMWVTPDGCHYDTKAAAIGIGLCGLCGCGSVEQNLDFIRDCLRLCDLRGGSREMLPAVAIEQLVACRPDVAAEVLLHLFNNLELCEHGSTVRGSWLTEKGRFVIDCDPASDA